MQSSWWTPQHHRDRRPALVLRAELLRTLRNWFHDQSFVEVEPDCLQVSPGNETHLHGFATKLVRTDESCKQLYLHTSPEFAMKKLLTAGEQRIFAVSRVFRNREHGPLHKPEFTMLEWYRTHQSYEKVMEDCCRILKMAGDVRGSNTVSYRGRIAKLDVPPERITVADAFQKFANIDLLATLDDDLQKGNRALLGTFAENTDVTITGADTWSDIFSKILTTHVEPNLGLGRPTLLIEYPLPEAALARQSSRDPRVGERFELYCCGIELANGFSELTDSVEQRRRFDSAMDEKQKIYGERYPIDEEYLFALERMPEASGVALGFDRLALLAAGAERLDQVVWTPLDHGTAD